MCINSQTTLKKLSWAIVNDVQYDKRTTEWDEWHTLDKWRQKNHSEWSSNFATTNKKKTNFNRFWNKALALDRRKKNMCRIFSANVVGVGVWYFFFALYLVVGKRKLLKAFSGKAVIARIRIAISVYVIS